MPGLTDHNSHIKTAALITAAGFGSRLGLGPKALLEINGTSLLNIVINHLDGLVDDVLVAIPETAMVTAHKKLDNPAQLIAGGTSRQKSIRILFNQSNADLFLIHDVARPFASKRLAQKVIEATQTYKVVLPCIASQVPVAQKHGQTISRTLLSNEALMPQAPQGYTRGALEAIFAFADANNLATQSIWELAVLTPGCGVHIVEGEETNIKITTRFDWDIATKVLAPTLE